MTTTKEGATHESIVTPRLARLVREVTVGSTDGNVEDEEEVLVEGSGVGVVGLGPGVRVGRSSRGSNSEVTTVPEGLVELGLKDVASASSPPGEESFAVPLQERKIGHVSELQTKLEVRVSE